MKPLKTWATAVTSLALAGAAQAALVDRGGGLIDDSIQDVTRMADLRSSLQGGVHGVDGMMSWEAARAWGCNCSQGEITRLLRDELGVDHHILLDDTPEQPANRNLFTGHGPLAFWTATPYAPHVHRAWAHNVGTGFPRWATRDVGRVVLVVRDGDVAQAGPEPASAAPVMPALGAGGLLGVRRRSAGGPGPGEPAPDPRPPGASRSDRSGTAGCHGDRRCADRAWR